MSSDAELLTAARAGSSEAYGRLVQRHQGAVRGFLGRFSPAEAEDLAQEAFVIAWSKLGRLHDAARFRAFVCGIGYRRALTRARGVGRAARRDGAWLQTRPGAHSSHADDRLTLEAAMAALAPDERAAVALCLAGDWTHGEAADALGLPLGTLKSHVARGRAKLLAALGETDGR